MTYLRKSIYITERDIVLFYIYGREDLLFLSEPELAIILAEKNLKIEDLTGQVEQLSAQLRHEQRVYQKKVEELKRDRMTARVELDGFVKKLDHLSDRYVKYDKDLEEKYAKLQEEHTKVVWFFSLTFYLLSIARSTEGEK